MMDDAEMGRPARHARPTTQGQLAPLDVTGAGDGEKVRVVGTAGCECGKTITVDFDGAEDSMGVRIARSLLASPRCEECHECDERERAEAETQAAAMRRVESRLARSGLPMNRRFLSFEELRQHPGRAHQDAALEAAHSWAREREGGLLLYGAVGRGKTEIARSAAVLRCSRSDVRWLPVAELLMDLRMPFDAPEYVRAQRRLEPGRGTALVLDDLDKLRPTEHQLQPLYVAINAWTEAKQPLLVTCNRDPDELADWMGETFGEPIASRLVGYCDVVEIKGDDWRLSV